MEFHFLFIGQWLFVTSCLTEQQISDQIFGFWFFSRLLRDPPGSPGLFLLQPGEAGRSRKVKPRPSLYFLIQIFL